MVAHGDYESIGSTCPITVSQQNNGLLMVLVTDCQGSHEPVGTIVAMGSDAQKLLKHQVCCPIQCAGQADLVKVGDRIGAYCLKAHCGTCADCTVFGDATLYSGSGVSLQNLWVCLANIAVLLGSTSTVALQNTA